VRLIPKDPPGRVNRKARAFETEIARLRAEGYTCEAIRTALNDVGVQVSLSTVQREAIRSASIHRSAMASLAVPRSETVGAPSPAPAYSPSGLVSDPRTSKEIAAEFVSNRINNRLLRERAQP
jgi:hypothetical protein